MALRVAFFGTPAFAVPSLRAVAASVHRVVGVVTQPDRPRGRGQRVVEGEVKRVALDLQTPVLQPERLKAPAFLEAFDDLHADVAVVAAYGKLLPQLLLDRPRLGFINVHASLLPRWRGAAPIHRAILAGDAETGVTIMRVVLALDAGPMMARVRVPIDPNERSSDLESRLSAAGSALLLDVLDDLERGRAHEEPQDPALVTYAARLERRDSQVEWANPAVAIHNQIRGLHPWPLATVVFGGVRLRLLTSRLSPLTGAADAVPGTVCAATREGLLVATGSGGLLITEVQPEGRAAMPARDFANGYRVAVGARFEPLLLS